MLHRHLLLPFLNVTTKPRAVGHSIPELVDLRNSFLTRMFLHFPLPHSLRFDHASATHYLKLFVLNWDSVVETAKFIHEVVSLWRSYLKDDTATSTDDDEEEEV
ncbi:hypothetical protein FB446DRAFT_790771 [Lentinula raphanica]|nr:hypothetical protein FB446DRAFT_790771 [Lentinula raphanica]